LLLSLLSHDTDLVAVKWEFGWLPIYHVMMIVHVHILLIIYERNIPINLTNTMITSLDLMSIQFR
jgi:hypothetical protein